MIGIHFDFGIATKVFNPLTVTENRCQHDSSWIESVKLEKNFDFEIRLCGIGLGVKFWVGMRIISKPTYQILARHEKSHKHPSIACGQFLRLLWTFWMNNKFLAVFTHQWPLVCIIYPQLSYFCSRISNVLENIEIFAPFLWLGDTWICRHFSIWKIGLRTKINFFHVW